MGILWCQELTENWPRWCTARRNSLNMRGRGLPLGTRMHIALGNKDARAVGEVLCSVFDV